MSNQCSLGLVSDHCPDASGQGRSRGGTDERVDTRNAGTRRQEKSRGYRSQKDRGTACFESAVDGNLVSTVRHLAFLHYLVLGPASELSQEGSRTHIQFFPVITAIALLWERSWPLLFVTVFL